MKTMIRLLAAAGIMAVASAAEKDVWYDASGKVVKVTAAEKSKKVWVPGWKQEELARLEALKARRDGRASPRVSRYYEAYPRYYGYGGYYPGSYGHRWHFNRGCYTPARFRFSGSYHGNGWSIHLRR